MTEKAKKLNVLKKRLFAGKDEALGKTLDLITDQFFHSF
jgi:hypothetical protein